MDFLDEILLNNALQNWLRAAGILAGVSIFLAAFRRVIKARLVRLAKKSETELDDFMIPLLNQTKWFTILAVGIYLGAMALVLPDNIQEILDQGIRIFLIVQVGFWGVGLIDFYIARGTRSKIEEDHAADATTLSALGLIGKIILWVILTLILLDNLGVEINSLVASLGIGGIAVALAVQNILGDLFASLTIALDKPFVIGDAVEVDNFVGDVENIGLKSTRIRSLSGEELIFSNNDLLNSRIRNYKRLEKRRISFSFGVVYGTPLEKLKLIPGIVEEIITPLNTVEFERVYLTTLGDYSLDFGVVYHVLDPSYKAYLDIQQTINFDLYRRLEQEGIEFAYPTQTIFMEK
jgi:small-conductance mechanosensitive channel